MSTEGKIEKYISHLSNFIKDLGLLAYLGEHYNVSDSMSNLSELSGNTAIHQRARMEVVIVIDLTPTTDNFQHRKMAYEDIKLACNTVNANLQLLQFEKIDFGETNSLENFYNSDVALVDLSVMYQQSALSYHLGVRESFGMKNNIVISVGFRFS
jgi:mitogen-activated protein kinase kinase kinase 5